jgi:cysteine desulfurase
VGIYFDHAATTPMSKPAIDALNLQISRLGNASSLHTQGRSVRKEVEEARETIARVAGCSPSEIIFTGSGTEANNLAIKGFYWKQQRAHPERNIIIISAFEHHAVMDPVEWLEAHEGAHVIQIPVTRHGVIDLEALAEIVEINREKIAVIAVMHSNNEVGTVQPIHEVVRIAAGIPVHTDAVQSFGKIDFNFDSLGVTSATISAHKVGGPLGVAALILQRGIDITPILHGGGQERDIRSGTLNAPAIVSFAAAAQDAESNRVARYSSIRELRTFLIEALRTKISDIRVNGDVEPALPGIANITFPGTESDGLLLLLDAEGIACSTGSACSAGVPQASHVLLAMGISERDARSSLRFSLGVSNTRSEIDHLASVIGSVVERSRAAQARH